MALNINALKQLATDNAELSDDMNEVEAGGGGRQLPAGCTLARLVQVVELGAQPREFEGKAKDPAMEMFLGFELLDDGYCNEDGTPYLFRTFSLSISRNEKAGARKLFLKLNHKGLYRTFGECIDELYLLNFKEVDDKKNPGKKRVVWDRDTILPPLDPRTKKPYDAPEANPENYKLFLWNNPTIECWESLKIEGTRTDDKGNVLSKNWIQEKILSATNYEGSPLQALLGGELPTLSVPSAPAEAAEPEAKAAPAPVRGRRVPTAPAAPALPAAPEA